MSEQRARDLRDSRSRQLTELGAIMVLSVSAFGSSYANFQESLWDGEQDAHYALAMAAQTAASKEESIAVQRESVNAMHFTQWLNAYAAGNSELEAFYRDRFQPGFRQAFDSWIVSRPRLNPDSPSTPFDVPGYRAQTRAKAQRLAYQSAENLRAARHDTQISDSYGQSVVIFALALFLSGIVQGVGAHRLRTMLVVLGALAALLGLVRLAALPSIRLI